MTKKLSTRLLYGLLISILVLMTGFLGLGVRAFESATTTGFIFLTAFGILLVIVPLYFILRRPVAGTAMEQKIRGLLSARSWQVPGHMATGRKDRPRPLEPGQVRAAVADERQGKQLAGSHAIGPEPIASETLRG
jgi:hypothetical protein